MTDLKADQQVAEARARYHWAAGADAWDQWADLGQDEKDALIAAERSPSR
jgi:hypothetical protein